MSESAPFGLAPSLKIAIAATNLTSIAHHVGTIRNRSTDVIHDPKITSGPAAIKIRAHRPTQMPTDAPLWSHPDAQKYFDILYAREQLWVHVDYTAYRRAWLTMMYHVARNTFLDHVQNRRTTWLRNSVYPYIRLVPVPHGVNTNAGHGYGGEGMEFAYTKRLQASMSDAAWARELQLQASARGVIYADPFDLTKMLSLPPGTQTLDGVRDFQHHFFPRPTAPSSSTARPGAPGFRRPNPVVRRGGR